MFEFPAHVPRVAVVNYVCIRLFTCGVRARLLSKVFVGKEALPPIFFILGRTTPSRIISPRARARAWLLPKFFMDKEALPLLVSRLFQSSGGILCVRELLNRARVRVPGFSPTPLWIKEHYRHVFQLSRGILRVRVIRPCACACARFPPQSPCG